MICPGAVEQFKTTFKTKSLKTSILPVEKRLNKSIDYVFIGVKGSTWRLL